MGDRSMDNLKDMICRELEEIAGKGEMSAGELDTVYKLIVSKEKLLRIEELEEGLGYSNTGGYSRSGEWRANGSYGRGGDSYRGDSYGRHYVRGHYSRGGYSMGEGRSMMADKIMEMMDDESLTSADKMALRKAMEQLQK